MAGARGEGRQGPGAWQGPGGGARFQPRIGALSGWDANKAVGVGVGSAGRTGSASKVGGPNRSKRGAWREIKKGPAGEAVGPVNR
jgi:hypothetical protein